MNPAVAFVAALIAAFFLLPGIGHSQDKKATAQQERMKGCNAQASAKGLQGRERQAFMSSCLKRPGGLKKKDSSRRTPS